jgi:hypothetical protein
MNWKGFEQKRDLNDTNYPGIFLEMHKKTTKNLSEDSWCAGRNLNRAPFESKFKLLNQPAQFYIFMPHVMERQLYPWWTEIWGKIYLRVKTE